MMSIHHSTGSCRFGGYQKARQVLKNRNHREDSKWPIAQTLQPCFPPFMLRLSSFSTRKCLREHDVTAVNKVEG